MIEIKNLTKKFGDFTAVDSMNLTVEPGMIYGFLGPNGAGKSTTLKMMTGVLKPTEGDVLINGVSVTADPLNAKRQIGYVSDSTEQFLSMTCADYLAFIASVFKMNRDEAKEKSLQLAEEFSMQDNLNTYIADCSHGMRQKIFLIGALIHNPSVFILDEPMTGLDPASMYKIKEIMRKHADEGNTVLFSTHVLDVAEKICDQIGIINKGQLIFSGSLDELRERRNEEDSSLETLFLELTDE